MERSRLREARGYIPAKVVAKDIGISESSLRAYENGSRRPKDEIKVALANYYRKSVKYLFF